jgi:hypothetical protein
MTPNNKFMSFQITNLATNDGGTYYATFTKLVGIPPLSSGSIVSGPLPTSGLINPVDGLTV